MLSVEKVQALARLYALVEKAVGGDDFKREQAMRYPIKGVIDIVQKVHNLEVASPELETKIGPLYTKLDLEDLESKINTHLNLELQGVWQLAYVKALSTQLTPIEQKRKEHGITRAELAEASGVPARTIADWESRRRSPRGFEQLDKLAAVLNCKTEELIERRWTD